jgi:D-alanine-D-alanine ligase
LTSQREPVRVAVLFGGRSGEHEVSVNSMLSVVEAMDRARFEPVPIGITKQGAWLTPRETEAVLDDIRGGRTQSVELASGEGLLARPWALEALGGCAIAFPLVHGTNGEDGTLQGLLELARIPYVGAGVAASAVGMDKELMKRLFIHADLPVAPFVTVHRSAYRDDPLAAVRRVESAIGYPCFTKPANGGSSVGITKVRSREDTDAAYAASFDYDRKTIVERAIEGREIECAVLGNDNPEASPLGEILPSREFYDYEAKYLDDSTRLDYPVDLGPLTDRVRDLAVRAYQAIDCAGMARVDFFVTRDGEVLLNEINTIPGFTRVSMYPKLWEAGGLAYPDLISRLIELGFERTGALQ